MRLHIKTLLIINIIITTSILLSKTLLHSSFIFVLGLVALVLFYGTAKIGKYFKLLYKFKALFISLLIFQLLFRRQGEIYLEYYFIKITSEGVFYAFNSLLRYFVILLSATMLSSSSPYQMIKAIRTWHVPEAIIFVVSFTIQFLRQLEIDFKILNQNLKKRNITFKRKPIKKRFELIGALIIPIIGRLFSDIKYKVIAMEFSGYGINKNIKPFYYQKCRVRDYLVILAFLGIIIISLKSFP